GQRPCGRLESEVERRTWRRTMFKAIGLVLGVAVALAMLGGGLYFYTQMGATEAATKMLNAKNQPFFPSADHTISLNQELNERVGSPMTYGEVVLKNLEGNDDSGTVMLDVNVSGPKLSGHAQIKVTKANHGAPWVSKGGDFFPTSG